jgi:hypothetical protein
MVFNATFNNISAISWRSVLLVEETGGPGEDHPPAASHWQTLSHNVVSSWFNARSPTGSYVITLGHIIPTSSKPVSSLLFNEACFAEKQQIPILL